MIEYTNEELLEAYQEWKKSGQAMHQVLLDIWHMVTPGDTKYLTYGENPETVFQVVRDYVVSAQEDSLRLYLAEHVLSNLGRDWDEEVGDYV